MLERLRVIPLFAQFPQGELQGLLDQSIVVDLTAGEFLFHDGDAPTGFFVILDGELEISKVIGGQTIVLAKEQPGSFIGEIALLTGQKRNASARATVDTRLLEFEAKLIESVKASPIAELLLATMAKRLRDTESQIRQQEKLSALGKLSAGLAHELNNPASANVRAARQIPSMLADLQGQTFLFANLGMNEEQMALLIELGQRLITQPTPPQLDAITLSDLENNISDWLDERGVVDGWKIAPSFAAEGIGIDTLEMLGEMVAPDTLPNVVFWLDSTLTLVGLSRTVAQSATRISEMIRAVKAYTYMDEAPLQIIDIHDGIENTLLILSNRLGKVAVQRDYDPSSPRLNLFASEINQVWTKVIENALDAMTDKGTLTIRTRRGEEVVTIEIIDNGKGIPDDIQMRVFEPFFSTKPMGTGLGLDIARRIVHVRHGGDLRFVSKPGETRFIITLPLPPEA